MEAAEAIELARRSIYHATFRDTASGGTVSVYHVTKVRAVCAVPRARCRPDCVSLARVLARVRMEWYGSLSTAAAVLDIVPRRCCSALQEPCRSVRRSSACATQSHPLSAENIVVQYVP